MCVCRLRNAFLAMPVLFSNIVCLFSDVITDSNKKKDSLGTQNNWHILIGSSSCEAQSSSEPDETNILQKNESNL